MFLTRFNAFLKFSSRRKSHIRREMIKIFRHDETNSFFQHEEMNDIRFQSSKNRLTIVQDSFFCEARSTFSDSSLIRSHRSYFVMILLFLFLLLFLLFRSYDHIALILSRFFFFSFIHTITSLIFCRDFSSSSVTSSQSSLFNEAFQSFFLSVSCFAHRNSDLQHEILIFNSKLCSSTRTLIFSIVTTKKK